MNILASLNKKEKELLKIKKYTKNNYLFFENEKCNKIGIILNGSIKITSYSLIGHELIFNILKENQIFGNNLIFSSSPYYKGDILALEDCKIAYLKKEDLLKLLNQNKEFLLKYLEIQSNISKDLNSKIRLLSLNGKERIIYFLNENDGTYHYRSITDLAKLLNLERETLSRIISSLIKEKIIIKKDKTLIIK